MGTIRFRITLIATAFVLAVLSLAAWAVTAEHRRVLHEQLVENLMSQIDELSDRYQRRPLQTLVPIGDDDAVARVVDRAGELIAASANLDQAPPFPHPGSEPVLVGPFGPEGKSYQVVGRALNDDLSMQLATPTDDIDQSVAALIRSLAIAVPAASAFLMAAMWILIGKTLRPVERIRAEVASISGVDLKRRVHQPRTSDEIGRLASTMNAMLDRLAEASVREQRFVADASHELRTPLTRMRSELEVDLSHPETSDATRTARSLLAEVEGLQRLTDDLLLLARLDAGAASKERCPIDLGTLVKEEAAAVVRPGVSADLDGVSTGSVVGDPEAMRRVVRNVIDNAFRNAYTLVAITLQTEKGEVVLTVADDGPGIPAADAKRVFDRFVRLDDARAVGGGGVGLGLAIVRQVVESHGGSVIIDPQSRSGARLVIRLPSHGFLDEKRYDRYEWTR